MSRNLYHEDFFPPEPREAPVALAKKLIAKSLIELCVQVPGKSTASVLSERHRALKAGEEAKQILSEAADDAYREAIDIQRQREKEEKEE